MPFTAVSIVCYGIKYFAIVAVRFVLVLANIGAVWCKRLVFAWHVAHCFAFAGWT